MALSQIAVLQKFTIRQWTPQVEYFLELFDMWFCDENLSLVFFSENMVKLIFQNISAPPLYLIISSPED